VCKFHFHYVFVILVKHPIRLFTEAEKPGWQWKLSCLIAITFEILKCIFFFHNRFGKSSLDLRAEDCYLRVERVCAASRFFWYFRLCLGTDGFGLHLDWVDPGLQPQQLGFEARPGHLLDGSPWQTL
jgi:hypothetical protein